MNNLNIPNHIAVIMDGNARWARRKFLPINFGHKAGLKALETFIKSSLEFKIKYLTIYAFSTENWQRPQEEVGYLMKLLEKYLQKDVNKLIKNGVRIFVVGDLTNISATIKNKIAEIEKLTANNEALILNVAFDYGSRQEIVSAMKKIVLDIKNKKITFDELDQSSISNNLYNPQIPDPDLLIRTAGEFRLSNFLLWQMAYTEFYFTKKLWPDFDKEDLYKAILEFNKRERRYGKR